METLHMYLGAWQGLAKFTWIWEDSIDSGSQNEKFVDTLLEQGLANFAQWWTKSARSSAFSREAKNPKFYIKSYYLKHC